VSVKILSTAAQLKNKLSCATNLQQIEAMELENCGRPACNKLCASYSDASTVVAVINKLESRRSTCCGKIYKVHSLRQSSRGKCLFWRCALLRMSCSQMAYDWMTRRKRSQSGSIQITDKRCAGSDNVDYVTGQVTTPGLATLLTSPQNYRDAREAGHGEKG